MRSSRRRWKRLSRRSPPEDADIGPCDRPWPASSRRDGRAVGPPDRAGGHDPESRSRSVVNRSSRSSAGTSSSWPVGGNAAHQDIRPGTGGPAVGAARHPRAGSEEYRAGRNHNLRLSLKSTTTPKSGCGSRSARALTKVVVAAAAVQAGVTMISK
jgi:hypothetical protein